MKFIFNTKSPPLIELKVSKETNQITQDLITIVNLLFNKEIESQVVIMSSKYKCHLMNIVP